jgi:hypothetical protein
MGHRQETSKLYSSIRGQSLAEQLFELRELRELVRKAEAKRRQERSTTRFAFEDRDSVRD